MSPIPNHRLIYNSTPGAGYPILGETTKYDAKSTIDLDTVQVPAGHVLVKLVIISVDPYMRMKMRDPEVKSYTPAYDLGKPISGHGIAKVLRSNSSRFKTGDYLYSVFPFEHYSVVEESEPLVIENKEGLPWSLYVGVLGMPGQTAFYGYKGLTEAKKGETIYISTAAGPVGSTIAQLAKADGLKVIGSAGSDDKVQFLKDIGVDVAFNYKTTSTAKVLQEHGPVDIYWDQVGGEMLDTVLLNMAMNGRVIIVGQASQYNTKEPYGVKNTWQIMVDNLTVRGLLIFRFEAQYQAQFYAEMPGRVKSGEIKYSEHITKGLENADKALLEVLAGKNTGKGVVIVSEE